MHENRHHSVGCGDRVSYLRGLVITDGGSGVVATELGIELAARGHQVHFITYSQPFRLTGREEGIFYHEVPVSNYPLFEYPPYDLALATRMSEVAEYYELDLLHVHYAIPHSVCALLARQMLAKRKHLPFVTTLHGTDITLVGLDRSYLPITRFAIEESDGVTSISNYLREKTVHDFGILRPIEVIPNFVNCDEYKPLGDTARRCPGPLCRSGREDPAPPFELPPGQAHPRCDRGLLPGRARDARPAAHGGRWTRPFLGRMAGEQQRAPEPGPISGQTGASA